MNDNKFEELSYIRDEMLLTPDVPGLTIWNAAKLALEDDYLYNTMIDWMRETNIDYRDEILKDVIDYTDEVLRKMNVKNDSY